MASNEFGKSFLGLSAADDMRCEMAFLGPLLAIVFMWFTANSFTTVFWIAVIPAFLSFALIAFAVREPERPTGLRIVKAP